MIIINITEIIKEGDLNVKTLSPQIFKSYDDPKLYKFLDEQRSITISTQFTLMNLDNDSDSECDDLEEAIDTYLKSQETKAKLKKLLIKKTPWD